MLYLPAGWFHQVTSSEGRHVAVNFWWLPEHWEKAVNTSKRMLQEVHDQVTLE
jgi:hypothetical protein